MLHTRVLGWVCRESFCLSLIDKERHSWWSDRWAETWGHDPQTFLVPYTPNMHSLSVNYLHMFLPMDISIFSKHNLPLSLGKSKYNSKLFFFPSQSPKDCLAFLIGCTHHTLETSLRMSISWLSKMSRNGGRLCVKALKKAGARLCLRTWKEPSMDERERVPLGETQEELRSWSAGRCQTH